MKKQKWVYDIEIFPNFFSVIFIALGTQETLTFYIHDGDTSECKALNRFLHSKVSLLIGYNNHKYDDYVLAYIRIMLNSKSIDHNKLYEMSSHLVGMTSQEFYNDPVVKRLKSNLIYSVDLMRVLAHDKLKISLKQTAVAMKWKLIQDLPKPFDATIDKSEIEEVLYYNLNDVAITKELAIRLKSKLSLRKKLTKKYGIDLMSSSRSAIGDRLISKFYSEAIDKPYWEFKHNKTPRSSVALKDVIFPEVNFKSSELNETLSVLKDTVITELKGDFELRIPFKGKKYDIKTGGLHSVDSPGVFQPGEGQSLTDADVSSYYPRLMIEYDILPEHINPIFLTVLNEIIEERLAAKAAGNMITSDSLKIVINAIYGKLNFELGFLYDPKAALKVVINGQLFLLMLIERLEEKGFKVISANTDGVTAFVNDDKRDEYMEICTQWEKDTKMELDYVNYEKIVRNNVNNYMAVTSYGVKTKGKAFLTDINLSGGYNSPIVGLAVYNYFINNIPVDETLTAKNMQLGDKTRQLDIYDFCIAKKGDRKFKNIVSYVKDGNPIIEEHQKTFRFYIANTNKTLVKKNTELGNFIHQVKGYNIEPFNEYFESDDYNINYRYYKTEVMKIINKITNNFQYSLL